MHVKPKLIIPLRISREKVDYQPFISLLLVMTMVVMAAIFAAGGYHLLGFSLVIGTALGYAFQRSRFCLTAAYRDFIMFGNTEMTRAVLLILMLLSLGFVIIFTYSSYNGAPLQLSTRSFGIHTMVGAALFGIGMVIAGGCATGMMMRLGEGSFQQVGTFVGFLIGSLLGAWHRFFWIQFIQSSPIVFLPHTFGWPLAFLLQMGVLLGLYLYLHKRNSIDVKSAAEPKRWRPQALSGVWSYNTGAVVIALLSTALYYYRGRAYGVTTGLTYWAVNIYNYLGGDVSQWTYFNESRHAAALESSFFMTTESMLNLGFIVGAAISALIASEWRIRKARSYTHFYLAALGGVLMGYGSRLAQGCNIGSLLSAVGSFSVQGWVFAVFVIVGAYIGTRIVVAVFMK